MRRLSMSMEMQSFWCRTTAAEEFSGLWSSIFCLRAFAICTEEKYTEMEMEIERERVFGGREGKGRKMRWWFYFCIRSIIISSIHPLQMLCGSELRGASCIYRERVLCCALAEAAKTPPLVLRYTCLHLTLEFSILPLASLLRLILLLNQIRIDPSIRCDPKTC